MYLYMHGIPIHTPFSEAPVHGMIRFDVWAPCAALWLPMMHLISDPRSHELFKLSFEQAPLIQHWISQSEQLSFRFLYLSISSDLFDDWTYHLRSVLQEASDGQHFGDWGTWWTDRWTPRSRSAAPPARSTSTRADPRRSEWKMVDGRTRGGRGKPWKTYLVGAFNPSEKY